MARGTMDPGALPGAVSDAATGNLEPDPKAYMAQIIGSKGPLSKPTTVAQPWRRELVFMPLSRPCRDSVWASTTR
jgi:hypothetical protein